MTGFYTTLGHTLITTRLLAAGMATSGAFLRPCLAGLQLISQALVTLFRSNVVRKVGVGAQRFGHVAYIGQVLVNGSITVENYGTGEYFRNELHR